MSALRAKTGVYGTLNNNDLYRSGFRALPLAKTLTVTTQTSFLLELGAVPVGSILLRSIANVRTAFDAGTPTLDVGWYNDGAIVDFDALIDSTATADVDISSAGFTDVTAQLGARAAADYQVVATFGAASAGTEGTVDLFLEFMVPQLADQ